MLSRCLLRGAGKHGTDVGSPLPHTWCRFEDTSSSICPAPPPLPSDRVASVGWKPQSGNLAKGGWGTPSSAALQRVGWFLFLSWPVRCGAVGWVQGPPVLEGPGRRSGGLTLGEGPENRGSACPPGAGLSGRRQPAKIVQTGHCANTPPCVTSIVQTGVYWRVPSLGCPLTKSAGAVDSEGTGIWTLILH